MKLKAGMMMVVLVGAVAAVFVALKERGAEEAKDRKDTARRIADACIAKAQREGTTASQAMIADYCNCIAVETAEGTTIEEMKDLTAHNAPPAGLAMKMRLTMAKCAPKLQE